VFFFLKSSIHFQGEQYLTLLAKHKPKFEWDASNHEHIFHYDEGAQHHVVYYPTLKVHFCHSYISKQNSTIRFGFT
jgi:hypothetical protein